jgi:hypothetical protein
LTKINRNDRRSSAFFTQRTGSPPASVFANAAPVEVNQNVPCFRLVLVAIEGNNLDVTRAKTPSIDSSELFERWRLADQKARTAERLLFCEAMRSRQAMCEFPSSAKREQAKNLRASANELFELAMAKMNEHH